MKPYLELPHLLSLTWLAYPILSLLFVAFRLRLSLSSSEDAISSAKADLLASCSAAERAATAAASMPRYMAISTNRQFAETVNGTINGARELLILSLTGMEAVINFIVDIYRSTFLCFLELVVRGGLEILISAVKELNTLVNNAAGSLRTSIQNDINNANSIIRNAVDAVNKVNPFTKITAPQIAVPSLDSLQNLSLPSSFQDALVQLNNTIPSVDDLKQKVNDLLDKPFELVKADINDTFSNIPVFDAALLPTPSQNTVTFCDQLDTSVVDDLSRELVKMAKIGFVILILTALLLTGLNCLLTWYKWSSLKRHLEFTRQAWMSDPTLNHTKPTGSIPEITLSDHNLLMLQANMHHPLITRILNNLAAKFRLTQAQHSNVRWFFHYIFHPPALACFLIGFFGLLSVEIQLIALRPLDAQFSKQVAAATTDFSHTIATAVNASMYNQSATYANDINGRVDVIQSSINNGMFGWVNGTTTTLNTTINAFYADIQNAVSTVFNGTILETPAQEFIRCFIGSKVDAIDKTLTFLHDNLHVNMPRVNESVLVLSPQSVNEVTLPIARAAVGSGNNDDTGVVGKIIRKYEAALQYERVIFSIFMCIWGVVVLMGLCILLWSTYGRRWLENRRRNKWQKEQRSGINGLVVPFKEGLSPIEEKGRDEYKSPSGSLSSLPPLRTSPFKPFATFNNQGNRAASPTTSSQHNFAPTHPRFKSDETLVMQSNDDEEGFFEGLKASTNAPRPLTAMDRLKSIRKKTFGWDPSEKTLEDRGDVERGRDLAWIGRVRSKLAQNLNASQQARLSSQLAATEMSTTQEPVASSPSSVGGLNSRWSDDTMTPTSAKAHPWRTNTSRPDPPTPLAYTTVRQIKSISSLPPTNDVDVRLSKDISSQPSRSLTKPTTAPVPLYNGFVNEIPNSPQRRTVPQPPIFDWTSRPRMTAPPNPTNGSGRPAPRVSTSILSSAFSDEATNSFSPVSKPPISFGTSLTGSPKIAKKYNGQDHREKTSISSVTRLLTTRHPRQSSDAINPFVTPFDDEHRVLIETDNPARKSMATNPFAPTGVAL